MEGSVREVLVEQTLLYGIERVKMKGIDN